ncbi:component of SufBCD complex [Actibacterium sp. 188UL27-1]|uniref:component of SufBCD complex n=1 Tax=Actibacterium sp. 188UL27-1 TaxID=2786961 RepID=UPI00195D773B|nr:component of SufBCD complex [Actibacterium sp. 188UL27-1]MBM7069682.1 component of SufBCD complex [Actibacterium sp. 188UL27-1]
MDWYETVFELIDLRSFSNLWYWIALAVVWSSASHYVLGVPYDMVARARRYGGEAEDDLRDIVRVNVNRIIYITDLSGLWILAFGSFALTALATMGFLYGVEFAQAVFLLAFPLSIVLALTIHTARGILQADGQDLYPRLSKHRFITQVIGMISIFITSIWGMLQNMALGPWGGF